MDIVGFRACIFQRQFDPNRSPEEKAKAEKEVYEAVMGMTVNSEEDVTELLLLLGEYCPAVLQLLNFMAEKTPCDGENPDFSRAREIFLAKS